jgi:hypothetical protein
VKKALPGAGHEIAHALTGGSNTSAPIAQIGGREIPITPAAIWLMKMREYGTTCVAAFAAHSSDCLGAHKKVGIQTLKLGG